MSGAVLVHYSCKKAKGIIRAILNRHPPKGWRRKLNDFIVAYFIPTWLWGRWHNWFWNIGEMVPDKIGKRYKVPGGYSQEVGITVEDIENISSDVTHLLQVANGDPSVVLSMVAYVLEGVAASFVRADVEAVLGFPVSEEIWPALHQELGHFNEHVLVCHVPLVQEFVQSCWNKVQGNKEGFLAPELRELYEKITGRQEWRITGG